MVTENAWLWVLRLDAYGPVRPAEQSIRRRTRIDRLDEECYEPPSRTLDSLGP